MINNTPFHRQLADAGFSIFPLAAGAKIPHKKEQHPDSQKSSASTDLGQIAAWEERNPGCNWAWLLGPNAVAIDVDRLDDGSPNPWALDPDIADELGKAGLIISTPNNGLHYCFARPDGVDWVGSNALDGSHVDIRTGENFHLVCAGSEIIPDGGSVLVAYRIVDGKILEPSEWDVPGPKLTAFLNARAKTAKERPEKDGDEPEIIRHERYGEVHYDNVQTFCNTSPGYQKIAFELFVKTFKVKKTSQSKDGTVYLKRPGSKNPWGATWNNPNGRDKRLGFPRMAIWSNNWPHENLEAWRAYSPFDIIKLCDPGILPELVDEFRYTSRDQSIADGTYTEMETPEPPPPPKKDSGEGHAQTSAMLERVKERLRPDGFIRLFCDEVHRLEYRRQPVIALASAVACLGALIGRKVRTVDAQLTGLLVLIAARTGMGKDAAHSLTGRLLDRRVEMPVLPAMAKLMPEPAKEPDETDDGGDKKKKNEPPPERLARWNLMPHSLSGLHGALLHSPSVMFLVDEIGGLLEAGSKEKNGNQDSLIAGIVAYSNKGVGFIKDRVKAEWFQTKRPVFAPCISLLGFTQPEKIGYAMTEASMVIGLTPRMLPFEGDNNAELIEDRGEVDPLATPEALTAIVDGWQNYLRDDFGPSIQELPLALWRFDAGAIAAIKKMAKDFEGYRKQFVGQPIADVITRCVQNAKRLATIVAADRLPADASDEERNNHTITADDFEIARMIVEASMGYIYRHLRIEFGRGEYERYGDKVVEYLRSEKEKNPKMFFSGMEIGRVPGIRSRWFDEPKNRAAVLDRLSRDGLITAIGGKSGKGHRYQYP